MAMRGGDPGGGKARGAVRDDKGQTLVEYALLLMLIAIVIVFMLTQTGQTLFSTYSRINAQVSAAGS